MNGNRWILGSSDPCTQRKADKVLLRRSLTLSVNNPEVTFCLNIGEARQQPEPGSGPFEGKRRGAMAYARGSTNERGYLQDFDTLG